MYVPTKHGEGLIIHDDSTISRVAWLLEQRKERITRYKLILSGNKDAAGDEYYNVNREAIEKALEIEKQLLDDLIDDILDDLFVPELHKIRDQYVMR